MKKTLGLSLLLLSCTAAQADVLGAKAGLDYWHTNGGGNGGSAYAQLEHPIPIVPNVAVRGTTIKGRTNTLNSVDLYGYYEILDNSLVSLDLGVGLNHFNSRLSSNHTLAMGVIDAEWLPEGQVSYYTKLNYSFNADDTVTDLSAGVRLQLFPAVYLQAGYRYYDLHASNNSAQSDIFKGFTAGAHIDI